MLSLVRGEQVGGLPPAMFLSKTADQLRSCYAVLRCVDAAVGSEPLPGGQIKHLQQLKVRQSPAARCSLLHCGALVVSWSSDF